LIRRRRLLSARATAAFLAGPGLAPRAPTAVLIP
jgi:hypothetical protein